MKTFTIGKTRSRASIAIVCAGTLAGAVALAAGCGGGDALAYLAVLNPTARRVRGHPRFAAGTARSVEYGDVKPVLETHGNGDSLPITARHR